jgi:hypothetical protein
VLDVNSESSEIDVHVRRYEGAQGDEELENQVSSSFVVDHE